MKAEFGTYTNPVGRELYKTVKIGDQIWMAQNLFTSKYRNGDIIPNVTSNKEWGNMSHGAWCCYNNDKKHESVYGRLYNWQAVIDARGLAPEGWHIPTDNDWIEMELYLGMSQTILNKTGWRGETVGGKIKELGTAHWKAPNEGATNESGFSGLPGGYRDVDGTFYVLGSSGYWWSSSEHHEYFAWYRSLYFTSSMVHRTHSYAGDGFSVRCIKDK